MATASVWQSAAVMVAGGDAVYRCLAWNSGGSVRVFPQAYNPSAAGNTFKRFPLSLSVRQYRDGGGQLGPRPSVFSPLIDGVIDLEALLYPVEGAQRRHDFVVK